MPKGTSIARRVRGALFAASMMLTACGPLIDEALDNAFPPPPPPPAPPPVLTVAAADLANPRSDHTATLLGTGKILVTGGWSGTTVLTSAELYDSIGNTWIAAGNLAVPRFWHTATLLPNGRVLVTGGRDTAALSSVELYDPTTNGWIAAGALAAARYLHTATLLPNGKVLVVGGFGTNSAVLASAELYDTATDTWAAAGSLATARTYHSATLLADGRVLVAGGAAGDPFGAAFTHGKTPYASAELYDPNANTWTAAASLVTARGAHTATLLSGGKVLVAGGAASHIIDSAELYDPAGDAWTPAGTLTDSRALNTATRLSNGKVLMTGGMGDTHILGLYRLRSSVELYDPATSTWLEQGRMLSYRYSHTATLLPNGKVLLVGGYGNGPNGVVATAELY